MKKMALHFVTAFIIFCSGNVFSETLNMTSVNWEPFYGENLPENGFFPALAREAFKRAGYEITISFRPWKRALEMARKGKYDGLVGAYYNEDRANTFYFTDPVAESEEVFVQNKGRGIVYKNLEELKKYEIGGIRGSAQIDELRNMGFQTEVATNYIMNIKKLNANRFDLLIIGKQKLFYDLENHKEFKKFKGTFEILEPPFKSYDIFCLITKKRADGQEIVGKFNKALQEMKADKTYGKILERFGQK